MADSTTCESSLDASSLTAVADSDAVEESDSMDAEASEATLLALFSPLLTRLDASLATDLALSDTASVAFSITLGSSTIDEALETTDSAASVASSTGGS